MSKPLGQVRIRPAVADLGFNIRMDLEFHVSELSLMNFSELQRSESTPNMKIPTHAACLQEPCISIIARIWIPPGLSLHSMSIGTRSQAIQYYTQLNYTIHNTSSISSAAGSIHMCPPQFATYSRETIVRTTSGSILGTYPLYDLLSIHTESAFVDVHIVPNPPPTPHPTQPASFTATAASGRIAAHYHIDLPVSSLANRDYHVTARTISGGSRGTYLHGSHTSLLSTSGSIDATLAPYGESASTIRTLTHSSSTRLHVLDSLTAPLPNTHAQHLLGARSHVRLPPATVSEHLGERYRGEDDEWEPQGRLGWGEAH